MVRSDAESAQAGCAGAALPDRDALPPYTLAALAVAGRHTNESPSSSSRSTVASRAMRHQISAVSVENAETRSMKSATMVSKRRDTLHYTRQTKERRRNTPALFHSMRRLMLW